MLACAAEAAHARIELVRWRQPDAAAEGFRVHVGTESGSYREEVDVGAATASEDGVYALLLSVPDASRVYVAVTAYNASGASEFSNEAVRRDGGDEGPEARSARDRHRPGASSLRSRARRRLAVSWPEQAELHASLDPRSTPDTEGLEVRGRLRIDEPGGGIGVTLRDPASGDDFYWLARDAAPGAAFTLASTAATLQCVDALPVPEAGAWYRFRLAVQPDGQETIVAAKVWPSGSPEPKAWAGCSDASPSRLIAPVPGLWGAGAGTKSWDRVKVARPPK